MRIESVKDVYRVLRIKDKLADGKKDTSNITLEGKGINKMIELKIVKTGKGYSKKDKWQRFDEETKYFPNLKDAKKWIKEAYGKAKRVSMYIDLKDGNSKRVGYVIGFRNTDWSHTSVENWIQRDWIEFREVNTITP